MLIIIMTPIWILAGILSTAILSTYLKLYHTILNRKWILTLICLGPITLLILLSVITKDLITDLIYNQEYRT